MCSDKSALVIFFHISFYPWTHSDGGSKWCLCWGRGNAELSHSLSSGCSFRLHSWIQQIYQTEYVYALIKFAAAKISLSSDSLIYVRMYVRARKRTCRKNSFLSHTPPCTCQASASISTWCWIPKVLYWWRRRTLHNSVPPALSPLWVRLTSAPQDSNREWRQPRRPWCVVICCFSLAKSVS